MEIGHRSAHGVVVTLYTLHALVINTDPPAIQFAAIY